LDGKRRLLALLMVFVLLATLTPVPVVGMGAADLFPATFARHQKSN
jgi:hypothetical protein